MDTSGDEIEVIVQSVLPADCPQGRFRVKVPPTISVEGLMRRVCKEASAPLLPHYVLKNARNQVLPSLDTLDNCEVTHGSILHWADETMTKETGQSWCSVWWLLCLIAFLIGATGLIAISIIKARESEDPYSYGIVFDAGSSHTSMYIYRWNGAKLNETAVAAQYGEPVTPPVAGMSSLVNEEVHVRGVMTFCLDQAKARIPVKDHKKTPVYLGATAGMRMLHDVNSTQSDWILDIIRKTVAEYPFKFNDSDIRIISGEEEGAFSWITSNYVAGRFHVTPPSGLMLDATESETSGALDLGGASAQITFIPSASTVLPLGYNYSLGLYGRDYHLYTHSYLCYGINEALRRYRAVLLQTENFNLTVDDPCAPAGWEANVTFSDIFEAPCVIGSHAIDTFGSRILPVGVNANTTFLFSGSSDLDQCQKVTEDLFNFTKPCNFSTCSFNGIYQPAVVGDFYAFSTFYYVTNFLNLTDKTTSSFAPGDFTTAIRDFCSKTWEEVQKIHIPRNQTLPFYCFQANFLEVFLTQAYGFNDTNWDSLQFVEKVAGTKIGWSLGFMLNKSNALPVNVPQTSLTTVTFVLLAILFGAFILSAVGFACHARFYRTAKRKRQYSRLAEYGSI